MSTALNGLPSLSSPLSFRNLNVNTIKSIHTTFHLLYHHNKNQHRCAKWWKWLGILKRWSLKLTGDAETVEKDNDFDECESASARVLKVVKFLRDRIIPRCYHAFSTVVADTQFSPLGIVLIANLARLSKLVDKCCIENSIPIQEHGEEENIIACSKPVAESTVNEDLGEVVRRPEPIGVEVEGKKEEKIGLGTTVNSDGKRTKRTREVHVVDRVEDTKEPKLKQEKREKKKVKKRKGNAIDDIFGGLF